MNLEEAKNKVRQAIKEKTIYNSEYEIDENGVIETDFAWYIPFLEIRPSKQAILLGAYYGFIVGKSTRRFTSTRKRVQYQKMVNRL